MFLFQELRCVLPWFRDCHFDGFVSSNVRYVTCSNGWLLSSKTNSRQENRSKLSLTARNITKYSLQHFLICGPRLQMLWTDIYLNRVCAKVYEIRVFKVKLEIGQWRLGKANLLRMTACGSDWKKWTVCWRYHNVNQNIGTRQQLKPPCTSDLPAFWNEKILFVHWKFSGMYCRERFDMDWRAAALQNL